MSGPLPVRIAGSASRAIIEAAEWWEINRPKAPNAFADELERAFQLLASQPLIGARARNAKLAGVRRLHLPRVHYTSTIVWHPAPRRSKFLPCGIPAAELLLIHDNLSKSAVHPT